MSTVGSQSHSCKRVETHILSLLEKLDPESLKKPRRQSMMVEVRTLDLWRAIIAECLATVFYVFLVCGSYSSWMGINVAQDAQATVVISLVSGVSMMVLVQTFSQVSGGHINPVISIGLAISRKISPIRASLYVLAQLGGGIAGAALLYGATSAGYSGSLGATDISSTISVWQGFGLEFTLTLVMCFVALNSFNPHSKNVLGKTPPAVSVGLAYLACTLVGFPLTGASMNPARSLGPAFVMNKWHVHWIYWFGPLLGGIVATFIHEYIFNPTRITFRKENLEVPDSTSLASEDETYDAGTKNLPHYGYSSVQRAQLFDQYNLSNPNAHSPLEYKSYQPPQRSISVFNNPPFRLTPGGYEKDIYSGSKSLYTNSPPLPRSTNLNRSQSVYTRPVPPRSDSSYRNMSHTPQNVMPKSPNTFTALLEKNQYPEPADRYDRELMNPYPTSNRYERSNIATHTTHTDSLYVTSKCGIVKPEPIYGTGIIPYHKNPDSGDSTYSTYRGGSSSYSSSSSATPAHRDREMTREQNGHKNRSRTHRNATPNSISGITSRSYISPKAHY